MSVERKTMLETLRAEALKDTDTIATKQRFALFSSPPPVGLGDDTYDKKERPKRDENGKVIVEANNIKVAHPKSGKIKSSYFSQLGFTTIGDVYVDPDRQNRLYELEKMKQIKNDAKFKPASGYKEIIEAPYPHHSDLDPKQPKKVYRDQQGKVQTAPKNVTTNPYMKKLNQFPQFMKDEYSRARDAQIADLKQSNAVIGEKPKFKTTDPGDKVFVSDKLSYGLDIPLTPSKKSKEPKLNIMKHENPFKPSNPNKHGVLGTIAKYPEYKGDPLKPLVRNDKEKTKEPFKPNHGGHLTRPTPTIACYPQNIRREMTSKFM